ncbi:hypothetical protein ABEG18_16790 [Alsobacter sp. KACC 23698]|uniref:Uncharacterized protein n=1 Tax=Alsobacter sp. KACC 23698 TaxID=3149229 RepID=A0AAU7JAN9_9HYPH
MMDELIGENMVSPGAFPSPGAKRLASTATAPFTKVGRYDDEVPEPNRWRIRYVCKLKRRRTTMGLGKGALLWMIGIPLPIIILLALFWR